MSVLVVGLSHKSAPLATLERAVLTGDARVKLLHDVLHAEDVAGALVLSTCNRVEIYAEVGKFHGAVAAVCELLSRHSGVPLGELTPYLYVHYEDRAVQHLLAVACGLDSMVVGESQILGQVRQALTVAREQGTRRPGAVRARRPGPADRQAGARRDRHRPGRGQPGQRRPGPRPRPSWAQPGRPNGRAGPLAGRCGAGRRGRAR